jgi:hypothetical protein
MRRELLASKKKETGLSLDPRTKLALLITIALFVLSGGGGAASKQFAPILAAVPLILLLTEKSWKGSVIYFVLYGGSSPTCPAFLTFLLLQSAVSLCGLCRGL